MRNFKIIQKSVTLILLFALLLSTAVFANENVVKETTYSPMNGVWVTKSTIIENGAFLEYQVVTCDLTNPNVKLDILYPKEGASTLKPTRGIGEDNGAAVIINADYFNRSNGTNKGSAVGYNQKDGKLLSNALEETVYSFSYSDDHQYSFDIFSSQIKIGFRDEVFEYVKTYNKYSSLEGVALFDRHWGEESLGSHGTLVELVIEDDVLTEIRRDMPPAPIPENGYVLAGLSDLTTLFDQVQVGDCVSLEILTTPELPFLADFTVGGGSLLVKEGKVVEKMSYPKSSTSFPAVGISQDGKTLWMITVVNKSSLTMKRMAELCQQQGAYYAMVLDGGGSTQCAVKNNVTGQLEYIHPLAGGYERAIANGLGILPQNEAPKAYGIHVEDTLTFQNVPKQLTYTVYNENGDPMQVDESEVFFSIKNGNGQIADGFFHGNSGTTPTLTVTYGDISADFNIKIVAPATHAVKNQNGTYTIRNSDGYQRTVTAEEFEKSEQIIVTDKLPVEDAMAEDKNLPHSISIYGGRKSYATIFDHLLSAKIHDRHEGTLYPFGERETEHEDIEIITVDNLEGQIVNRRMTEWNRLKDTLKTDKKNLIICLDDPISFSRQQEEDLFFDLLSQTAHEGKNILVIHRGDKTELKSLKDGVRVLSVAYDTTTAKNLTEKPTDFIKIHYSDSQMTYELISEQLFHPAQFNENLSD